MKLEYFLEQWENDRLQRSAWQILALLLALGLIANGLFFSKPQVVLVPPDLSSEAWIREDLASPEYLEQLAVFFTTFVGNYTPQNIDYVKKIFLSYVEPSEYEDIENVLQAQAEDIKRYNITQTFSPLRVELRRGGLAYVYGQQKRFQAGSLKETKPVYLLKLKTRGYQTKIDKFIIYASPADIDAKHPEN